MTDEISDDDVDYENLLYERRLRYCGTARIPLERLQLENELEFTVHEANIERLVTIFQRETVKRLKPDNFVNALVKRSDLDKCLRHSGISISRLIQDVDIPVLQVPDGVSFRIVHGQHRLRAAQRFLNMEHGLWWSVEIYDDRLSPENVAQLREVGSTSRRFCDGDIYRHFRLFQLQHDDSRAAEWASMLTSTKMKAVKQLQDTEPAFASALDDLLPYVGLWAALELGTLNRILPLHATPESVNYLSKTRKLLDFILIQRQDLRGLLDPCTVRGLETLAPGLSSADRETVRAGMHEGALFPLISDPALRGQILDRLTSLSEPICSLRTYLEETKLLQLGLYPLRLLLPDVPRKERSLSLRTRFRRAHERVREASMVSIQISEVEFVEHSVPAEVVFSLKFCQLFLCALRNFQSLTGISPRKDRGRPKPSRATESFESSLWKLAKLAHHLGFRTTEIERLRQGSPQTQVAIDFLVTEWPDEQYDCSAEIRYRLAATICTEMSQYARRRVGAQNPVYTTDLIQQPKQDRYGRPLDSEHKAIRDFLYADKIYFANPSRSNTLWQARFLTPWALRRFTIIAFFGDLTPLGSESSPTPSQPPAPSQSRSGSIRSRETSQPPPRGSLPPESPPRESPPPEVSHPDSVPDGAFTALPAQTTSSEFLQKHLQSTPLDKVIVYLDSDRHLTQFSKTSEGKTAFNECIQGLANQDHCFYVLQEGAKVKTAGLRRLWEAAQPYSMVIAVLKRRPEPGGSFPFAGGALAGLLSILKT